MGTTPIYKFRYPEPNNPADGPAGFYNLASDVETVLSGRVIADSSEIVLGGTPTAAHLTGTVDANWAVPKGDIVMGKAGVNEGHYVRFRRNVDGAEYEQAIFNNGLALTVVTYIGGVQKGYHHFYSDGHIASVGTDGQLRPLPYATYARSVPITLSNAASGQVAITVPSRFNFEPYIFTNPTETSIYYSWTNNKHVDSTGIGIRHYDSLAASVTVTVDVFMVQMLATGSMGLAAIAERAYARVGTCHVADCENNGVPRRIIDAEGTVLCGVCLNEITDFTTP